MPDIKSKAKNNNNRNLKFSGMVNGKNGKKVVNSGNLDTIGQQGETGLTGFGTGSADNPEIHNNGKQACFACLTQKPGYYFVRKFQVFPLSFPVNE